MSRDWYSKVGVVSVVEGKVLFPGQGRESYGGEVTFRLYVLGPDKGDNKRVLKSLS